MILPQGTPRHVQSWVSGGADTVTAGTTEYTSIMGGIKFRNTESQTVVVSPSDRVVSLSNFSVLCSQNTADSAVVMTVRDDEEDTALEITIGAGLTGTFTSAGPIQVAPSSELSVQAVYAAGTGSAAIAVISSEAT